MLKWKVGRRQERRWSRLKEGKWVERHPALSVPRTDLAYFLIWPRVGLLPLM